MQYAILAYHESGVVESWSPEQDTALMDELLSVHRRLVTEGHLGPAARLSTVDGAVTLRGAGAGTVVDGPFAETKEHLLGLYVVDCADREAAIAMARELRMANPTAVYEIRPIELYLPGAALQTSAGGE